RPARVIGGAVDETLAVERPPTGRARLALLPLAPRTVHARHQRPHCRPRHVERHLVRPAEVVPENCTLTVGSVSSVSGDSKSRVLLTSSVPSTVEPSAH